VLRALDEIHDRMESPADGLLRHVGARSSYFVLPVFALANAGVAITTEVWSGHQVVLFAIMAGLGNWQAHWIDVGLCARCGSALASSRRRIPGVNSAVPVH
jgi:hypothetical protein